MYDEDAAVRFAEIFLSTPFSDADRHVRRLAMVTDYESTGELPPRREDRPPGA
jgi:ribose 5-phosphate isomerase B